VPPRGLRPARGLASLDTGRQLITNRVVDRAVECGGHNAVWTDLVIDVIAAARALTKRPGVALIAVAIVALGIAINAAVFAVVRAAIFSGFAHVERNDRIVRLGTTSGFVYYPDVEVWRARAKSFEDIALARGVFHTFSDGSDTPQTYFTTEVTSNTFRLLRARPLLGRDFVAADEQPGAEPVVLLAYELWERTFGADPDVIGRAVRIDGRSARIIGVMPRGFTFPSTQQLWTPLVPTTAALQRRTGYAQFAYARLQDGVAVQRARDEMDAIGRALANEHPRTNRGMAPVVQSFDDWFVGANTKALYETVWAAAAFVLVVVCANLANLIMERAAARSHEIAIRLALGASHWRITRQFIVETLMMSAVGALLGWPLGRTALALYQNAGAGPPGVLNVAMDRSVLAFVLPLGLAAGVLGSLGASIHSLRLNFNSTLTSRTYAAAAAHRRQALSDAFVVAQVALAVVLLTIAGVLIRTYHTLSTANVGADTTDIVTMSLYAPPERYTTVEARRRFYVAVAEHLNGLPGVTSVAFGTAAPTEFTPQVNYALDGDGPTDSTNRAPVAEFVVSPTYFRTLHVAVVAGREFDDADGAANAPVAIVNQQFASRHWPGAAAIGKRVRLTAPGKDPGGWLTVVGVVANVIQNDRTRRTFDPIVYVAYAQHPQPNMFAFVRTAIQPEGLVGPIRRELYGLDQDLPLPALGTLEARFARTYAVEHQSSIVVLCFAAATLLIAALGLYATVSRSVNSRVKEIGIRRAIGATATDIAALVSARVAYVVGLGWLIGIVLSVGLLRIARTLTIGISMADPVVVLAMTSVLVLSALVGCGMPVVRATRVDPATALRCE
jgi:putative ABC transport system permease protein